MFAGDDTFGTETSGPEDWDMVEGVVMRSDGSSTVVVGASGSRARDVGGGASPLSGSNATTDIDKFGTDEIKSLDAPVGVTVGDTLSFVPAVVGEALLVLPSACGAFTRLSPQS